MKIFIIGPVQMYDEVLKVRKADFPYFRTDLFSSMMKNNSQRLASLIGCKNHNNLMFFTMSGTAAMEATIQNCVKDSDKCLVINGGTFGKRFCELLKCNNKKYDSIDLNWNEQLTEKHLAPFDNKGYTVLFVNLHETSSGQLYNIELLSNFCKKNGLIFIVDAISTFLADKYNMDRYDIDVTIISSQKGLCCSAGMSIIALSNKMLHRIEDIHPTTQYFNFKDYLMNMQRGQTPYTPAVGIVHEIDAILTLIDKIGLDKWLSKIEEKAKYFRKKASELGLVIPNNYTLSNAITPVYFENNTANYIVQKLREDFDIYVNPCGGILADKLLRVSHIGNTTLSDIDYLLEKISLILDKNNKEGKYDRK